MSGARAGLLRNSEREPVDKRLRMLEEEPITGKDELVLASAVHRSHYSRDTLVMSSLAMSTLALAVAVVVGGLATNDYVGLFLIGYLVLAGVLGAVTLVAIRLAVTTEVVRVIVDHRLESQRDANRERRDLERSGRTDVHTGRRMTLRRALGLLTRG